MLKIYFAGSIRGGRADADLYNSTRTGLSAMLTGNACFHIHPYTDEASVWEMLRNICKSH